MARALTQRRHEMTSIFPQRSVSHCTLLFLFLVILFTSGCAGVTIPTGEEYMSLSNAKITPEIISDDGSLIKVDYNKTKAFGNREKLLLGYFVSTDGLDEKPGAIVGKGVICYLLLSDLNQMNADLTNERDVIRLPITSIFDPTSKDWWTKSKVHQITGAMHSAEFAKFARHKKYVGNTTVSIFVSVDDKERISNILTVPVTFR